MLVEYNEYQESWKKQVDAIRSSFPSARKTELSFGQYVSEYRTILNKVPRQTGKSSFLNDLDIKDGIILTSDRSYRLSDSKMRKLHFSGFINNTRGTKVSCVFLDEFQYMGNITDVITNSMHANSDDFFIFGLGT